MPRARRTYYDNACYSLRVRTIPPVFKKVDHTLLFVNTILHYHRTIGFKFDQSTVHVANQHEIVFVVQVFQPHNISKIMQRILLSFSRKYQDLANHEGPVFRGRFEMQILSGPVPRKK